MDERLNYEFLFEDCYSIVVGAKNPLMRRRSIALADLMDKPWVLPPSDSVLGSLALEAFRASGLDYPHAAVITEPADVRISLLATGRFISIFPDAVLRFSARRPELKVLRVKQALSRLPVGIVTLKNRALSPLTQLFIAGSREVAKQLAKRGALGNVG